MYLITTAIINSIEQKSMCLEKYIESCPPELKCKLFTLPVRIFMILPLVLLIQLAHIF